MLSNNLPFYLMSLGLRLRAVAYQNINNALLSKFEYSTLLLCCLGKKGQNANCFCLNERIIELKFTAHYGMKAHCSLRNNFNNKLSGRHLQIKVFPVYLLLLPGEWKKLTWMNHFYRQVACKFTNYGRGCQINYAISIITN